MTKIEAAKAAGNAAVTPQGAAAAPAPAKATTKASQKKGAPKSARGGKPAATKTAPATKTVRPTANASQPAEREGSKKSAVLELLRRKDGATGAEIAKITKGNCTRSGTSSPERCQRRFIWRSSPPRTSRASASTR
jgi:hypothetical protein